MWQFLGVAAVLLVIVLVVSYWQWVLAAVVAVAVSVAMWHVGRQILGMWRDHRDAAAREARRLLRDAEAQHRAYLSGSSEGLYGRYAPVDLERV